LMSVDKMVAGKNNNSVIKHFMREVFENKLRKELWL
jgi:hypothetical protein